SFRLYSLLPFSAFHSFPTRRSSDLVKTLAASMPHKICRAAFFPIVPPPPLDRGSMPGDGGSHSGGIWKTVNACHSGKFILTALRSEEQTSELQSRFELVCRLLLETK